VYEQTYTVTGLVGGTIYRFKIEAHNAMGYGAKSAAFGIMAAAVPGTPSPPTTTTVGTNVEISWSLPYEGGSPVTGYIIRIRHADSVSFTENTIYCDGINSLTIINTRKCTVPVTVVTGEPYKNPWGSSIWADLQAFNYIGGSHVSDAGNGAVIIIVPDAPINLANVPSITNAYQVGLTWEPGASTGGTAITEYILFYDQAVNMYVELARGITGTGHIATGLTPGKTYTFKVKAVNGYGEGAFSQTAAVLTAQRPDTPTAPQSEIYEQAFIRIFWN
jgi:titin